MPSTLCNTLNEARLGYTEEVFSDDREHDGNARGNNSCPNSGPICSFGEGEGEWGSGGA